MNIGIIGFGVMGQIRLRELAKISPTLKVTKICETNIEQAKAIPSGIVHCHDYREITRDSAIDMVFVCPPNFLVRDCVVDSLDHGKHVFSEKPPGRNLRETEEMAAAEKRNPMLKLMFGFNHRHHEAMTRAKEVIDSGELGKILWMRGRYGKAVNEDFFSNWRSRRELAGGGIFLDQGIHMLDLFLMMAGNFDSVKADVSNLFWKLDVEDNVFAIYKNKYTGVVASLHSTMTQWRHLFSLEIFLEHGHIVINGLLTNSGSYGQNELAIAKNIRPPAVHKEEVEKKIYTVNVSWESEMKLYFDCIEKNKAIEVGSSADALKLMKLVDMTYKNGME